MHRLHELNMSDRGPETLGEGAILLVTSKIRLYVMADALFCYTREIRVRGGGEELCTPHHECCV